MGLDKRKLKDGNSYEDVSRLNENNLTSFQLALTMFVSAIFTAEHVNGKLMNKTYILGDIKTDTVITGSSFVVNTKADKPVLVDIGILGQPKLFVDAGALSADAGTIVVKSDCNFVAVTDTPVIMTVTGSADDITEGFGTVSLLGMKTGHKTYYPS